MLDTLSLIFAATLMLMPPLLSLIITPVIDAAEASPFMLMPAW